MDATGRDTCRMLVRNRLSSVREIRFAAKGMLEPLSHVS
jgi:hypothetical protein